MGILHNKLLLLLYFIPLLIYAEDRTSLVFIDPTIQSYDGLFSRKLSVQFYVGEIIDKRANAPSETLGVTRTGRNSSAPIVTRVTPAALLKNSIEGMLRELTAFSKEKSGATYMIQVEVLSFEIIETSKTFSQEIRAKLAFRVKIRSAANDELLKQFIITSEDARKALDTTKFAGTVASNAILNGLVDMLESLSWLK
jgi:hypothetical protein